MSLPSSPAQADSHLPDENLLDAEITAKRLVEQQLERQKRRRTTAGGPGSSARTSLWSTLAAKVHCNPDEGTYKFRCAVCDHIGSVNKTLSTSNIIDHYKTKHNALPLSLVHLNRNNATAEAIQSRITAAHQRIMSKRRVSGLDRYFESSATGPTQNDTFAPTQKQTRAVAVVMFACATENACSQIASPLLQGLVDVFGGRVRFSSAQAVDKMLYETYAAVCRILRSSVTHAKTGCITVDGWSAALGSPILGITWHYIDDDWNLRCVPIATLNMGTAAKTGQQLRFMIEEILEQNPIVGSDDVRVHTATSDNEAATALSVDLLTNFVGSVRCVVHTLALAVNDVFETGTVWKKYLDHVNKVTTYFNHHQKAAQLLVQKQSAEGITSDRMQRLKHDIPTRWHSRLAAMTVYLCRLQNISAVAEELQISSEELPSLSNDQQDVLAEVRRVARQLEADRKVTMSCAPRLLRELHETLLLMAGTMLPATPSNIPDTSNDAFLDDSQDSFDIRAIPTHLSKSKADSERDKCRSVRLRKSHPKALAIQLADRIESRLGAVWRMADTNDATWVPNGDEHPEPDREMHQSRRVLLFHIAAMLDINECSLDFLGCSDTQKNVYLKVLYSAVVREAVELDGTLTASSSQLEVVFSLFHQNMLQMLEEDGRKEPSSALLFWKNANRKKSMISPLPFNTVARAALSAQASLAPAERLFSDLGRKEGNQSQSLLSCTLEMTEMIRVFVSNELKDNRLGQSGLLHPQAQAFRRVVDDVAREIAKQ